MLAKPWFKIFVWFLTTFFFFITSAVLISIFKPGPTSLEVSRFTEGLMAAMDRSMMGVAMNLENDKNLQSVIYYSQVMLLPTIFLSILAGFIIRLLRNKT